MEGRKTSRYVSSTPETFCPMSVHQGRCKMGSGPADRTGRAGGRRDGSRDRTCGCEHVQRRRRRRRRRHEGEGLQDRVEPRGAPEVTAQTTFYLPVFEDWSCSASVAVPLSVARSRPGSRPGSPRIVPMSPSFERSSRSRCRRGPRTLHPRVLHRILPPHDHSEDTPHVFAPTRLFSPVVFRPFEPRRRTPG